MKGEPFSPSSREVTPVKHVKMYNFRIKLETFKRSVENDFFFGQNEDNKCIMGKIWYYFNDVLLISGNLSFVNQLMICFYMSTYR